MEKGALKNVSLLVGGGQGYYGRTAYRDKLIVKQIACRLYDYAQTNCNLDIQIITGGTGGIPDEFASAYKGRTVDIVSSKCLARYKKRTALNHRPYWVAGRTQEEWNIALATNRDITCAFYIFLESGRQTLLFRGSNGGSGTIAYKDWVLLETDEEFESVSTDPDASDDKVREIVDSLLKQICNKLY